jgi:hypothetical protein
MKHLVTLLAVLTTAYAFPINADSTAARCDIYPKGVDHASAMVPCTFGQLRGNVTLTLPDGVKYDLVQTVDSPGDYLDLEGRSVYRQGGLGSEGLIFRFEDESIYVYWDTSALNPVAGPDNWTAPYAPADYDATTRLRCGMVDSDEMEDCPAGILRMENGQASIVISGPAGKQLTINFMTDYINSAAGEVDARVDGDTWIIIINDAERYEVPLAAIEGG